MSMAQCAVLLVLFWFVLVGHEDVPSGAAGLFAAVLIAAWATSRLWAGEEPPVFRPAQWIRFAVYAVRLVRDIVVAAVVVAEKVLDPSMPIEPALIVHRVKFGREVSRIAFANSITLTPGTLTVDVDGDEVHVHCLAPEFGDEIVSGALERRIQRVFEEH